jgi:hypothetical protein
MERVEGKDNIECFVESQARSVADFLTSPGMRDVLTHGFRDDELI